VTNPHNDFASRTPAASARVTINRGRQALDTAIAARYDEGESLRSLANQTRLPYTTVRNSLVEQEVQLRPMGGAPRRRRTGQGALLRIGYSMWGFLTDGVLDTSDGSRAHRRDVINAIQAAGHQIVLLQANRDRMEAGHDLRDRYRFDDGLPDLDAVIVEWRWPVPGRNTTVCGSDGHTCELHRQQQLLDHYTHDLRTPTVIWDLDRQLPADDPLRLLSQVRVAEYALHPTDGAVTVTCPVPDALLAQANPVHLARQHRPLPLVYVGNQHDRGAAFEKYFAPAAAAFAHGVTGKWTTPQAWPHVTFTGRRRFDEVTGIYTGALATVLLLPDRYAAVGHQTSRLFEAVTRGCLPLTPADTACAEKFTPTELHVRDGADVIYKLRWLQHIQGTQQHRHLIAACLLHLQRYRLSDQVRTLLDTVHTLTEGAPAASGTSR
jgi:hypothetical protein